jgi:inner membrane protein
MEPLCHTLVGAALAESPLARRGGERVPLATATLLLAANLPDIDVLCYTKGADFALGCRRGWTHGALALAVLPLVLTAAVLLWDRFVRRRRHPDRPPAPPGVLLGLAYLGVLTHPLLDLLNTYGVRLLMPFSGRWLYGDTLFIVDPWLWLILGGAVVLARRPRGWGLALWGLLAAATSLPVLVASPRGVDSPPGAKVLWLAGLGVITALYLWWGKPDRRPRGPRVATAGLALAAAYIAALVLSMGAARAVVVEDLARRGLSPPEPADDLMVGPLPYTPFDRQVVLRLPGELRVGTFHWLPTPALELDPRLIPAPIPSPEVEAALAAPEVQGMVRWMRYPFFEVESDTSGTTVWILDARYTLERTTGFGGAAVRIERF